MKQTCGSCKWRPCGKQQCTCEDSPRVGENVKRGDKGCELWEFDRKIAEKFARKGAVR